MVLCFVTLTDLQTRRAGLSASAELLVFPVLLVWGQTLGSMAVLSRWLAGWLSVTAGIVSKRLNLS